MSSFLQLRPEGVEVDLVPLLGLLEVALVGIGAQLPDELVPVGAHRRDVELVHLVEIGGVEARRQHRRLLRGTGRVVDLARCGRPAMAAC